MSERKTRREHPAVNAGSMADIAFLLLIFFLVTTTIAEESGLLVKLPEWRPEDESIVQTPDVFTVIVNADDNLLVEDLETNASQLPELLRAYVTSPMRSPKRAVVSLVHDRSTTYTRYVEVYDAILKGYRVLWDKSALEKYGSNYGSLDDAKKREIRDEIPMTISEAEPLDVREHRPATQW